MSYTITNEIGPKSDYAHDTEGIVLCCLSGEEIYPDSATVEVDFEAYPGVWTTGLALASVAAQMGY